MVDCSTFCRSGLLETPVYGPMMLYTCKHVAAEIPRAEVTNTWFKLGLYCIFQCHLDSVSTLGFGAGIFGVRERF